jgi:hypothetical protein
MTGGPSPAIRQCIRWPLASTTERAVGSPVMDVIVTPTDAGADSRRHRTHHARRDLPAQVRRITRRPASCS